MTTVGSGAHGEMGMTGVVAAGVARGPHPFVNRAAVAVAAHVAVNPVDGAATVVIGDAGAFAAVTGLGGAEGSEGAKSEEGGEEESAEFHGGVWFGFCLW